MKSISRIAGLGFVGALGLFGAGTVAMAGAHTWQTWEVFSNAAGNIQFVTIKEAFNGHSEVNLQIHTMISHPSSHSKGMHIVTGDTAGRFYLLATADFAALPGAPVPDEILPNNFIQLPGDTSMEYSGTDTASWTLGALPLDGIHSLRRTGTSQPLAVAVNSPTNYAGVTASVDASGGASLPGVPDGTTGSQMVLNKLAADGSSLSVSWDTSTCSDANNHQILYGNLSGFPALPGGTYTLQGGTCAIGSTSPFAWTPTPTDGDGKGLIWFLIVTKNASGIEGSWGKYDAVSERNGTGTGGSSNVCTTTNKSVVAACGH